MLKIRRKSCGVKHLENRIILPAVSTSGVCLSPGGQSRKAVALGFNAQSSWLIFTKTKLNMIVQRFLDVDQRVHLCA